MPQAPIPEANLRGRSLDRQIRQGEDDREAGGDNRNDSKSKFEHVFHALIILLLAIPATAANLLNGQLGTAVPVNTWVKMSWTGYEPYVAGFGGFFYVQSLRRACTHVSYRTKESSSEPDRGWACYSARENNWLIVHQNQIWHDQYDTAGHMDMGMQVDPATSVAYGALAFSGSSVADSPSIGAWWFDFNGQSGRNKQNTVGIYNASAQPFGYFDPLTHVLVLMGVAGSQALSEYTPDTNTWNIGPTTSGTCYPNGTVNGSAVYVATDGKGYGFGGNTGGTVNNDIYTYVQSTRTCAKPTTTGTQPVARMAPGWSYDPVADTFLVYGGEDASGTPVAGETWTIDRPTLTWIKQTPAANPTAAITAQTPNRIVYFPEDGVHVLFQHVASGAVETWHYRIVAGQNSGATPVTPSNSTYPASAGSLNRVVTTPGPTWAIGSAIATDGSTQLAVGWSETGASSDGSGTTSFFHNYVYQSTSGGAFTALPSPSAYSSVDGTAAHESANLTLAYVAGSLWACWQEEDSSTASRITCNSWNGTTWGTPATIGQQCGSFCLAGVGRLANINGTPMLAYVENDAQAVSYRTLAYVKQWNGSSWALLGGALNVANTASNVMTIAEGISIASDGTNPYVAWAEYTTSTVGSPFINVSQTNKLGYLMHWSGSAWSQPCSGAFNVSTGSGWVSNTSVTVLGGVPYVAFTERQESLGGFGRVYVRKCSGGSWSTVGSAYLNIDQNTGHAYTASLTNDGTNLYVAWDEQGNDQQWAQTASLLPNGFASFAARPQVQVQMWNGSAWSKLGGSMNIDPVLGAASQPMIAYANGNPQVLWGETNMGNMRQMYLAIPGAAGAVPPCAITPSTLGPWTITQTPGTVLTASNCGSGTLTWTCSSMPAGTSCSGTGATKTIAGTTTTATSYTPTISVTDGGSNSASINPTVIVNAVPSVTLCAASSSACPTGTQGSSYSSQTIMTSGGTPPVTCTATGVPAGMTLHLGCTLDGTPTGSGTATLVVTATDGNGIASSTHNFSLTINPSGPATASIAAGGKIAAGGGLTAH